MERATRESGRKPRAAEVAHASAGGRGDAVAPPVRRVLFVCVANSCRSQMAEALARSVGGDRIQAWSAGSHPSGTIHPTAIAAMARRGLSLASHRSKGVGDVPSVRWDAVVTMGCGDACPQLPAARRLDWQIPDPVGLPDAEFDAVRDMIETKVRALLAALA
jgi:protein-tyrosine-phosphatase